MRPTLLILIMTMFVVGLAACGGDDDDAAGGPVVVPDGATLCGTFNDDYFPILTSPTAFGEDGWEDEAAELVRLSQILEQLAPADQADNAAANVDYFEALAAVESASAFVPGSNAFNEFLVGTC